jgi:zinc transporter ZupT
MQRPRHALTSLDLRFFRLASLLGALAFVGAVVVAVVADRPLVAAFGAGAFAGCILYLWALLYISRHM